MTKLARLILALALAGCSVPAPAPTPTPTPAVARPTTPTPFACPPVDFCYERLEIAGAVVPYTDVSGHEEIGEQIRSLPGFELYLVGHAYTTFGRIRGYWKGDVVLVHGTSYTVYDGIIAHCQETTVEQLQAKGYAGPLFMQTSLGPGCGDVLVVLAR